MSRSLRSPHHSCVNESCPRPKLHHYLGSEDVGGWGRTLMRKSYVGKMEVSILADQRIKITRNADIGAEMCYHSPINEIQ